VVVRLQRGGAAAARDHQCSCNGGDQERSSNRQPAKGQRGDERAGPRLARAIQDKGAFRRFKAQLHEEYPQLLRAWHAFRDARAHRRAVEWPADNSLVHDDPATRFLDEHPYVGRQHHAE
jgi:hypothetical protein